MQVRIESRTIAECIEFLKLKYRGRIYSLDEFSEANKTREFQIERLLPECSIIYRGETLTFEAYKEARIKLSDQLEMPQKYAKEIFPREIHLAICNDSYYKAAKFLEKTEECIQTARYYLMQGADIIKYDCDIPWKYGYQPIYDIRTINFTTAIIWYNNSFDYILQIAFLAFELFKKDKRFKDTMQFEELLRLCTFKTFSDIHSVYKHDASFKELWNILNDCHDAILDVNNWANYAKHKGGIGYVGLRPESPYKIYVGDNNGKVESRTSEFEPIILDIDKEVSTLINTHKELCNCLEKLVNFIGFENCAFTIDKDGNFDVPKESEYVKIQPS